jgi:hypothetical protein
MAVQQLWATSSILDLTLAHKTTSATVANDGSFQPRGFLKDQPGVAKWVQQPVGVPTVGANTITMQVREPTKSSRLYKVTVKLDLATLETISNSTVSGILPAPQKAYSHQAILEFLIPERGTLAERQVMLRRVASMFLQVINATDDVPTENTLTPLIKAIEDLEPVW